MLKNILHIPYFIYVTVLFVSLILLSFPITLLLLLFPTKIKDYGMFWLMKIISNIWFFCMGVLTINYNRTKIDKSKSGDKVDGPVSIVMALGTYLQEAQKNNNQEFWFQSI